MAALLLVAMATVLFAQVVFRYVLFRSLPWSEELARYMLVWFGLLSATAAAYTGQHFAIHAATAQLPERAQAWLAAAVNFVSAVSYLYLALLCYRYLDNIEGLHAVATGLDLRLAYAALPTSFFLLALMQALAFANASIDSITGARAGRSA